MDQMGALAGYIGGKDQRVTGHIAALPVYKGKLEKPPEKKPKGVLTEKQKAQNAYLSKYQSEDGAGGDEDKRKKKKRKVRRGEEPGRGLKIIDEDKGLGGLALARAKGALRCHLCMPAPAHREIDVVYAPELHKYLRACVHATLDPVSGQYCFSVSL